MTSFQLEVPQDIYLCLINHPDCPAYKGRRKWILQILVDYTNSPAFKARHLEEDNRRLRRDRDQKAKDAEFWKNRAGGGIQNPFASKATPAPLVPAAQDKTNNAA